MRQFGVDRHAEKLTLITVVYNLTISAAIATAAIMLVEPHKDAKHHILQASELRRAALGYVGENCSGYSMPDRESPEALVNQGYLDSSFDDDGAWMRVRVADYPHLSLVTRNSDNSRFKTYLDSLDMGQAAGARRQNRFIADTGAYRTAGAGQNMMLINGYTQNCTASAGRAEVWEDLCNGLASLPGNAGMACNPWNETP